MEKPIFYQAVKQFIIEKQETQLEELSINEDTNLIRQGLIDSFMIMEIIFLMEQLLEKPVDMENLVVKHIESMKAMYDYFVLNEFCDQ